MLTLPFTAFFLLGAINSLNLLDGMDGLLSTVGLILCLALGAMAVLGGHATATGVIAQVPLNGEARRVVVVPNARE